MMDKIDSVDEILEFAIAREVEANQLYMYMAKRMENPELSKVSPELVSRFQGIAYELWAKGCYTEARRGKEFYTERIYI